MFRDWKTFVVKIGSSAFVDEHGRASFSVIQRLLQDIFALKKKGKRIILVSSGGLATGKTMGTSIRGESVQEIQALNATGWPHLFQKYQEFAQGQKQICAQVLLTQRDLSSKSSAYNAQRTIEILLEHNVLPIINENDVTSYKEAAFGDNDHLAVACAQLIQAEGIIFLSGTDGLYQNGLRLPEVCFENFPYASAIDKKGKSKQGRGGIPSKLSAIKKAIKIGIGCILSHYNSERPLSNFKGRSTYFAPHKNSYKEKEKIFISLTRSGAWVGIDDGAFSAILKGASLLAVGVVKVSGPFGRGDVVAIKKGSRIIAHGRSEFHWKDVEKIKGMRDEQIKKILPQRISKVIIHRDHMVIK